MTLEEKVEVLLTNVAELAGKVGYQTGRLDSHLEYGHYRCDPKNQTPVQKEETKGAEGVREKIAEECHNQWTGWMRHLFKKCCFNEVTGDTEIPDEYMKNIVRQMETPYPQLTESEKESDRIEADKILKIIRR